MKADYICPTCEQSDQLEKVSIAYHNGVSEGNFSGPTSGYMRRKDGSYGYSSNYTTLSGYSQTDLSKMLVWPTEPRKPYALIERLSFAMIVVPMFFCGCLTSLCSGWVFVSNLVGFGGIAEENLATASLITLLPIIGGLILIGLAIALGVYITKKEKITLKKQQMLYEKEKYEWDRAIARWHRAVLCHRDGTIFDPIDGVRGTLSNFTQFLYA